jgi:hypothetical protein
LVRAFRHGHAPSGTEAPGGTSRSTSRGLTGQGPAGFRRPAPPVWRRVRTRRTFRWCRRFFERRPVTRASPQPDPLGHLLSRDRGAPEGESGATRPPRLSVRTSPERRGAVRLQRSRRATPFGLTWPFATRFRGAGEGRGPLHPSLREEVRDRLHPRCLPSRSHPDLDTRLSPGIFGRMGPSPQIVTNLWRTHGAVASHRWQTHAPTRLP